MIEIDNLIKSYGQLDVIKGINMNVEKGEVISIIGASGSGKSTLLYCINALENIQGGRIIVDGIDAHARDTDVNALRTKRYGLSTMECLPAFNHFRECCTRTQDCI